MLLYLYLFIVNIDHSSSVCVKTLEGLSEPLNHDTALDEIIKFHRVPVVTVKNSCAQVTKIYWAKVRERKKCDYLCVYVCAWSKGVQTYQLSCIRHEFHSLVGNLMVSHQALCFSLFSLFLTHCSCSICLNN